jgi:hypothetical protein
MSFLYPRTIKVMRPAAQDGVGAMDDYVADTAEAEVLVVADIPASIQAKRAGGKNPVGLPADGGNNAWQVMTPPRALSDGTVINRDIIVDDLGRRFQVVADYTNSLGGCFHAERLEA